MRQISRVQWVFGTVALSLTLGTGALLAQVGGGVTFQNDSKHAIDVFARYGSDGSCESLPNQVELPIAGGASRTVDSGTTKVCFCLAVPARNSCPTGWGEVKPGGKRIFR